jgi:hypothetical protein
MLAYSCDIVAPQDLWNGRLLSIGLSGEDLCLLLPALALVFVVGLIRERGGSAGDVFQKQPAMLQFILLLVGILSLLIWGALDQSYIPQEFIYRQI